jgi:hypothetical protein
LSYKFILVHFVSCFWMFSTLVEQYTLPNDVVRTHRTLKSTGAHTRDKRRVGAIVDIASNKQIYVS